jgi:hypothetical protein
MIERVLLANSWLTPQNFGQLLVNILAVVGGFFLGAWLSGWLLQRLTGMLAAKKPYPAVLWVFRLVGGVALAWVVALFVFGKGGLFGLGGGGGPGTGPGDKDGKPSAVNGTEGDHKGKKNGGTTDENKKTLRVEVLGKVNGEPILTGRFYRIKDEQEMHNLNEVLARIDKLTVETPPLKKVEIILYKNSPAPDRPAVADLQSEVQRKGLEASITTVAAQAPAGKAP